MQTSSDSNGPPGPQTSNRSAASASVVPMTPSRVDQKVEDARRIYMEMETRRMEHEKKEFEARERWKQEIEMRKAALQRHEQLLGESTARLRDDSTQIKAELSAYISESVGARSIGVDLGEGESVGGGDTTLDGETGPLETLSALDDEEQEENEDVDFGDRCDDPLLPDGPLPLEHSAPSPPQLIKNEAEPPKQMTPSATTTAQQKAQPAQQQPKRKTILMMSVDIGDGRMGQIKVCEGDSCTDLAHEFVLRYGLADAVVGPLAAHIESNVSALTKKAQQPTPSKERGRPSSARPTSAGRTRTTSASSSRARSASRSFLSEGEDEDVFFGSKTPRSSADNEMKKVPSIDPKSRKLAAKRSNDGKSAFERLHEQAEIKKKVLEDRAAEKAKLEQQKILNEKTPISEVSQKMMKGRGGPSDIGERLYKEGLKKKEELLREAEKRKQVEEADPEATFKPKISSFAKKMVVDGQSWRRILSSDKTDFRKRQLLEEEEKRKNMECTFKPHINQRTERMMNPKEQMLKELAISHFDQLYIDAERRRLRNEEYSNWRPDDVTFHPDLGPNRDRPLQDRDNEAFIDRLVNSKKHTEALLEDIREKVQRAVDPKTGKPLFRPDVAATARRTPTTSSDSLGTPRFELAGDRERLQEEEARKIAEMANRAKASERSRKIFQEAKRKSLQHVFEAIDTDKDGLIDLHKLDLASLDPTFAKSLLLILNAYKNRLGGSGDGAEEVDEMEGQQKSERVDFATFFGVVDAKWDSLKIGPKSTLLVQTARRSTSTGRRPSSPLEGGPWPGAGPGQTDKPHISEKSEKLAENRRKRDVPLHEALMREGEEWEEKRRQLAMQKAEKELKECTFTPKIAEPPKTVLNMFNSVFQDEASQAQIANMTYEQKLDLLTKRLMQKGAASRMHDNKPKLTSEEIEFLENCTFTPELVARRPASASFSRPSSRLSMPAHSPTSESREFGGSGSVDALTFGIYLEQETAALFKAMQLQQDESGLDDAPQASLSVSVSAPKTPRSGAQTPTSQPRPQQQPRAQSTQRPSSAARPSSAKPSGPPSAARPVSASVNLPKGYAANLYAHRAPTTGGSGPSVSASVNGPLSARGGARARSVGPGMPKK